MKHSDSSTTVQKWCTLPLIFYWPVRTKHVIIEAEKYNHPRSRGRNDEDNYKIHCTDLYIMPFVNKAENIT